MTRTCAGQISPDFICDYLVYQRNMSSIHSLFFITFIKKVSLLKCEYNISNKTSEKTNDKTR